MVSLAFDPKSGFLPDGAVLEKMAAAARDVCAAHGIGDGEISLSFVSPEAMKSLNNRYRAVDAVTDVLSFPAYESAAEARDVLCGLEPAARGEVSLGDVVICTERAEAQAAEYGHGAARELVYLFVHGVLHLLGYDHEDEAARAAMRTREEATMEKIGLGR